MFGWSVQNYDVSSITVQKQVYALRCDMLCSLISLRMYDACYDLLEDTAYLVQKDLNNKVVEIGEMSDEILKILKITAKYFYLRKMHLSQA